MPQVGFLHTAHVHVSTFEGLVRDIDDGTACLHSVEPDLLDQVRRSGPTVEVEEATLWTLQRDPAGPGGGRRRGADGRAALTFVPVWRTSPAGAAVLADPVATARPPNQGGHTGAFWVA